MDVFAKYRVFLFGISLLALSHPAKIKASENEIRITEAVRGEVGTLSFTSYTQDRGPVKQGDALEFRFAYTEDKSASVRILGVHQECGCLSQSLQAGQEIDQDSHGELIVRVDATHFVGTFDKQVIILTNEDRERPHVFRMRATVEKLIQVSPPLVQLEGDRTARVIVQSTSKQTLRIEKVQYNKDTLEVQINPVQETWELLVRWKGESAPAHRNETLELLMDGPVRSLKIPVVRARGKSSRISLSAPR